MWKQLQDIFPWFLLTVYHYHKIYVHLAWFFVYCSLFKKTTLLYQYKKIIIHIVIENLILNFFSFKMFHIDICAKTFFRKKKWKRREIHEHKKTSKVSSSIKINIQEIINVNTCLPFMLNTLHRGIYIDVNNVQNWSTQYTFMPHYFLLF